MPVIFSNSLLSGVSGALAGISTEIIFYGLDSYKVGLQTQAKQTTLTARSFTRLFRGVLPIASLGSGPSFGVFFCVYDLSLDILSKNNLRSFSSQPCSKDIDPIDTSLSVFIASVAGGIPSSIVSVPADVLKKRLLLQANKTEQSSSRSSSIFSLASQIMKENGLRGFFLGWQANLLKDVPFAAVKMSLYEGFADLYLYLKSRKDLKSINKLNNSRSINSYSAAKQLSELESSLVGGLSGAATAILTNPLDVVNSRIKSGEFSHLGVVSTHIAIIKKDGFASLYKGIAPRMVILSLGSSVFWFFYGGIRQKLQ